MLEAPEIESHRHKTGHSVLDFILGGLAVFLSMVSIFIALHHGRTMERLVEANSWPNLNYFSGNLSDDETHPEIRLVLRNTGVGPARIDTLELFYKDKPYATPKEFLAACCGKGPMEDVVDQASGMVLPARESITFLRLLHEPDDVAAWDALNKERFSVRVRACYCSVFDECWVMDSTQRRPERTHECEPSQPVQYRY
jgi:hypothetical protein